MMAALRRSLWLAALLLLAAASAGAHAFLDHADPRVGSKIKSAPAQVRLWFTQQLEPAFSTVRVLDAAGKQVDKQDAKVDAAKPDLLTVSVPPLGPGTYRVVWRVLSVDTHVTEGDFTFTVAP
ncbi:MAG TPA: copper resistance CopC family protein [Methylomirabilota bacterium]|nr:copper resistance CopC family protein [Methylomirabilota bacterium]